MNMNRPTIGDVPVAESFRVVPRIRIELPNKKARRRRPRVKVAVAAARRVDVGETIVVVSP